MLSILIPNANYNAYPLAREMAEQARNLDMSVEIIVSDNSQDRVHPENFNIASLQHTRFYHSNSIKGRSANRNFLIQQAHYDTLLFVDSDSKIVSNDFLETYSTYCDEQLAIVYGGTLYRKQRGIFKNWFIEI